MCARADAERVRASVAFDSALLRELRWRYVRDVEGGLVGPEVALALDGADLEELDDLAEERLGILYISRINKF